MRISPSRSSCSHGAESKEVALRSPPPAGKSSKNTTPCRPQAKPYSSPPGRSSSAGSKSRPLGRLSRPCLDRHSEEGPHGFGSSSFFLFSGSTFLTTYMLAPSKVFGGSSDES